MKYYYRYMDDVVVMARNKKEAIQKLQQLENF